MLNDLGSQLIAEYENLKGNRHNWEAQWQEIAELMIPRKADFTATHSTGSERRESIFESTPVQTLTRFSSGLHNTLTSSSIPWFTLKVDRRLEGDRRVQLWLEETTRILQDSFNRPSANFHPSAHEYYLDLGAFGTSIMEIRDIPGRGPYFRSFPLSDCYLATNALGRIDTCFRHYEHTVKELIEQYPMQKLPDSVKQKAEKNKLYDKVSCLHIVKPRKQAITGSMRSQQQKPFMSVYMLFESKHILNEGGFDEFPFVCSRWERNSQEIYGRGPGINTLPDVRMLNEMEATYLKALQKTVDPPLMLPHDGFLSPVRTVPGGLNYYRAGLSPNERIEAFPMPGRLDWAENKMGQVREAIGRGFFLDTLELPGPTAADGDVMRFTATEIAARQRDRLQILGPIVSRQEIEFLGPMIERTMFILIKNGMVPQPPPQLMQSELGVEYMNPVSIAMRSSELSSIGQLMQFVTPWAQIDPSILERFDSDKLLALAAEILRVPLSVLKSEEQLTAEREQKQMMQMQQQQLQQTLALSEAQERDASATAKLAHAEAALAST